MKHEFIPEEFSIFAKSPLESAYAETFVYAPSSKEEDGLGHLYIVVEISSNKSKKENAEFVSRLANVLKNEFYKNTIVTPVSALRFSLKRVNRFLEETQTYADYALKNADKNSKFFKLSDNLKLAVLVAALKENSLHLSKLGDTEAIILRGNTLQHIVTTNKVQRESALSFENIVSGEVLPSDRIVLATHQIHKISEAAITQKLQEKELSRYIKEDSSGLKTLGVIALYPKGHTQENKAGMSPLIQKKMGIAVTPKGNPLDSKGLPFGIGGKIANKAPKVRMAAMIAILVVSLIAVTAVALKIRHDTAANKKEAEVLITDLSDLEGKISAMIDLKNEAEADGLLATARSKISRLEKLGYFQTTRISLAVEFEKMSRALKKVSAIENLNQVFSLENSSTSLDSELDSRSSLRADFDPRRIAPLKNMIVAFDGNTMYKYDLNKETGEFSNMADDVKIASILPKPESPEKGLTVSSRRIYEGVSEIWSGALAPTESEITQARIYNNAFYLLGDNSLIYKLPFEISSSTLAWGDLILWSDKDSAVEGQIGDFAVDGSIFALTDPVRSRASVSDTSPSDRGAATSNGTDPLDAEGSYRAIVEMVNGDIKKKIDVPEGAAKIFTSPNHKNIYILSPKEGLVLMFDKNLNIQKRLSRDDLKGAKSFFVNSQERIIYFLKGKTVYAFEI